MWRFHFFNSTIHHDSGIVIPVVGDNVTTVDGPDIVVDAAAGIAVAVVDDRGDIVAVVDDVSAQLLTGDLSVPQDSILILMDTDSCVTVPERVGVTNIDAHFLFPINFRSPIWIDNKTTLTNCNTDQNNMGNRS